MIKKYSYTDILKFIIPSIIGMGFFMIPISYQGSITIPIAILSGFVQDTLADFLPGIMTCIIILTLLGSITVKLFRPAMIEKSSFFKTLFDVSPFWFIVRIVAAIFAVMIFFQLGPEAIWSEDTGGLILLDLLPILFAVFLFAGMLLPLLLNFGLLEFFGALLTKVMRPLFKLPGRSSIDSLASWLGDGTIGVLLTSKQYEEGYYTKREAAVIGTTFSIVSITFSLVVLEQVGLERMFVPYYLTITFAGFIAALIMPRIPPLSRKEDTYFNKKADNVDEVVPDGFTPAQWGFSQAVQQAKKNDSVKKFLQDGSKNILDMWMGVAPVVMAFGTLALIIAEYTRLFAWLGMPFIPLLELMQVPEAQAASETLIVGFADMFLPAIIGSGIESEMTRFIIAAVSVTQLIYLSEVGGLLLGSKISVSLLDLFIIFIQRTLITLPIIVLIAHFLF